MIARYPLDRKVYRAKVLAVRNSESQTYYSVLYLDYGNICVSATQEDLYDWDPLLELIQPQAHLCSFLELPAVEDFSESFAGLMGCQGPMKLRIHRASVLQAGGFRASLSGFVSEVELVVSLTTEDGRNVLESFLGTKDQDLSHPQAVLQQKRQETSSLAVKKVTDWLRQVEVGNFSEVQVHFESLGRDDSHLFLYYRTRRRSTWSLMKSE